MRKIFNPYFIFIIFLFGRVDVVWAGDCAASETSVPITFRFQEDSISQSAWLLDSLKPMLTIGQRKLYPTSVEKKDGSIFTKFCPESIILSDRFSITIGPRSVELAARPVVKGADGLARMSEILLLNQPKPNWVIVKSIERLSREDALLPSFDIELFNFGPVHPGGRVVYKMASHQYSCIVNRPGNKVTVKVSLINKRLKIASSDPEYPEEIIERSADVRSGFCGSNFALTADFGSTGDLPTGPTRIRYLLQSANAPTNKVRILSSDIDLPGNVGSYFPLTGYDVTVQGEGIW